MHMNHLLVLGQLHLGPVLDGGVVPRGAPAIAIVLTGDSDSLGVAFGFGDLLSICQVHSTCFLVLQINKGGS